MGLNIGILEGKVLDMTQKAFNLLGEKGINEISVSENNFYLGKEVRIVLSTNLFDEAIGRKEKLTTYLNEKGFDFENGSLVRRTSNSSGVGYFFNSNEEYNFYLEFASFN